MYNTVFRVDDKDKIILDTEAVKLCPGLKKVDQRDLLFIILAYDYNSPYRRLEEDERIRRAKRIAYKDDEVSFSKAMINAITEYRSLQYDERREIIQTYRNKVQMLRTELMDENETNEQAKYITTIRKFQDEIERLTIEINKDDEMAIFSTGGKLSMIEKWQANIRASKAERERQEVVKQVREEKTKKEIESKKSKSERLTD